MAEMGLVCDGPNSYQIWLGGSFSQTRLAETFAERVKLQVGARGATRGLWGAWVA
jgi:sulfite reductase (ferredoxin)